MKILLIGDYSSFHYNLKEGLIELGHNVDIASTGDGFKQTGDSDISIPFSDKKISRIFNKIYFPFSDLKSYYGYDVVQLVDHNIFGGLKFNYNEFLIKQIKKNNGKIFLSACSTNAYVYYIKDKLRYNYVDESISKDYNGKNRFMKSEYIRNNVEIANLVDGIIPVMYTYKLAYNNQPNLLDTIPLPINLNNVKYTPQKCKNNRLKIFHGITREGFKGTEYIRKAMKRIKENYPNDVDICIDGKMPLKKYLKILEETNIVIDQSLSYEYGMNAIYSMAMGKVVLSGNELECQQEFGRKDIPIINIEPSEEDIYNKLEKLVLNKKSVIEIGEKSRLFVEDFHHHVKVAQKYIDTWNSIEVKK